MKNEQQLIKPYVLLLIIKENKILLLKREKLWKNLKGNFYGLPGGKIEVDEYPKHALVREAFEELDITINIDDLTFVHTVYEILPPKSEANLTFAGWCFSVSKWEGIIKNKEPDAHESVEWFDFDKLPENLLPIQRHIIEMVQHGITYSEFVWPKGFFESKIQ